jgi:hypothetical protein
LLKQQVGVINQPYGKLLGTENLHTEQLSQSLFRIVELAKHEHHPVIWEFYFCKSKENWIISQLNSMTSLNQSNPRMACNQDMKLLYQDTRRVARSNTVLFSYRLIMA